MSQPKNDFRNLTFEQALSWTRQACRFDTVRQRIKSKSVCWILLQHLEEVSEYAKYLEAQLAERTLVCESMQETINNLRGEQNV